MLLFGRWWSDEQGRMKEPLIGQWNTARDRWEFANAEGWWGIRPECWMPLPDTPSNDQGNRGPHRYSVAGPVDLPVRPWCRSERDVMQLAFDAPNGLHPQTADLVARFAQALAEKLHKAEKKYGYSNGWLDDDWQRECANKLVEHVQKGDPRDVAAYCAFMWHHGWRTSLQAVVSA